MHTPGQSLSVHAHAIDEDHLVDVEALLQEIGTTLLHFLKSSLPSLPLLVQPVGLLQSTHDLLYHLKHMLLAHWLLHQTQVRMDNHCFHWIDD